MKTAGCASLPEVYFIQRFRALFRRVHIDLYCMQKNHSMFYTVTVSRKTIVCCILHARKPQYVVYCYCMQENPSMFYTVTVCRKVQYVVYCYCMQENHSTLYTVMVCRKITVCLFYAEIPQYVLYFIQENHSIQYKQSGLRD